MEFTTKIAFVVADDLATWQKLNVVAFLTSGVMAATENIIATLPSVFFLKRFNIASHPLILGSYTPKGVSIPLWIMVNIGLSDPHDKLPQIGFAAACSNLAFSR